MGRTVYLASGCDARLAEWLESECGCTIEYVHTEGIVAAPVSDHPDMFLCRLGIGAEARVVSCLDRVKDSISANGLPISAEYPLDIAYNAACTGSFFIHNLRYTAPELKQAALDLGCAMIDVRQGYAKCSTVIVDERSIITYDRGIGEACKAAGMDVLLVFPGHVLLPGYNTGFIGGASGRIGDTVVFNGDLSSHPDFEEMTRFIERRGLKVKWFKEWPLTDTGSIY